ncbi:MAG: PhzF family phenazine biosynthesis isomerase [Steroidobacteraceae bacterium]
MASIRVFQVDAFTSQRFTGNPAGVVLDAAVLPAPDMRALARELGSADTAFVLPPDGADHDLRVRFLTPTGEAPFIGHATLAVHAVLASLREPPRPLQKHAGGIVQVDTIAGASPPRIAIHQPPPPPPVALDPQALPAVLDALALTASQLDPRCPPVIAGAGGKRLLLGLSDSGSLAQVQPDMMRLAQLSTRIGAAGTFLFTLRPALPDVFTEARMFCPSLGIAEDPVSGNAHALLGAYLWQQGLIGPQDTSAAATVEFTGAQGGHIGRPGHVTVALGLDGGSLQSVSMVGEAVVVFATTLEFPAGAR